MMQRIAIVGSSSLRMNLELARASKSEDLAIEVAGRKDWPAREVKPLTHTMHYADHPIKTKLADRLPQLTRRERRELLRDARKRERAAR